jgi:general secretion pathway protein B
MSRACKPTRDKPMSYILDALKRADAERGRGAVPGLHARQLPTPAARDTDKARHRLWLAATAATLMLGGIAAGLWFWQTPGGNARPAAMEAATTRLPEPAPVAQSVAIPKPIAAPVPLPIPAHVPAPVPAPIPRPVPAPVPAWQATVPARAAAASSRPVVTTTAPATPKARPVPLPLEKASAPQAAMAAIPMLSELPEDLRRDIPKLIITGTVYSENPKQRLLLVNGQVLSEGSLAAPDVNVEEIRTKSAVFSFRGTRFRVAQ